MVNKSFTILFLICSLSAGGQGVPEHRAYKDASFTELFRSRSGWIAGDGAFSFPVTGGRTFWTFGDSYMDCLDDSDGKVPCLFQARNALIVIDINIPSGIKTLRSSSNGDPSFFRYGTDRKYWFWPLSGFSTGDYSVIFLARMRATGEPGMWGFAAVDTNYIAKIHNRHPENVTFSILPQTDGIVFGTAVISRGKYTYIYGIRNNGMGNDLFVARFRTESVESSWEFFDGEGWNTDKQKIRKIHSEFTSSFNVCRFNGKYFLVTTEFSVGCDQGKKIFVASANDPFGPFTGQHPVWQVDDTLNGHYPFFYCANAHPEFDNGKNELLITYSINGYGSCVETCNSNRMDPDVYRPRAIRVPFSLLLNK